MTIYLMTGTPGSGKSLHMARMIYWRTRRGNSVIANFEIDTEKIDDRYFQYVDNMVLSPDYLLDYSKAHFKENDFKEGGITLFIDECQLIFNARSWNEKGRNEWIKFFTQHRKLGYDIYLIAQFDYMIDKQLRSLVEYEIKHRKLNNFGKFGTIVNAIIRKPVIVAVDYWYPLKQRLRSETFIGKEKYYSIYDTTKIFG